MRPLVVLKKNNEHFISIEIMNAKTVRNSYKIGEIQFVNTGVVSSNFQLDSGCFGGAVLDGFQAG